jgi:hypothetical protein
MLMEQNKDMKSKFLSNQRYSKEFSGAAGTMTKSEEEQPLRGKFAGEKAKDHMRRLDTMVDAMGITDLETGMPPISDEERAMIKLQLLAAQILVRDVLLVLEKNRVNGDGEASIDVLVDRFASVWSENIANFAKQVLSEDVLKLNVTKVLKEFGQRTSWRN